MGFFDMFQPRKSEFQKMSEELAERLFPGGRQEILFKMKTVSDLSNGKLSDDEAARVCWAVKTRVFLASSKFDGRKNLGPDVDRLLQQVKDETHGKLATTEAAAIVFYLAFNKVDPGLNTLITLRQFFEVGFGSDARGCDCDEIPSGLGEFGFDPTNPIPVRGTAANEIYLDCLRTSDGHPITHKRLGSLTVPNIDGSIDEYEISRDGQPFCKLYICPYNRIISGRPPRGFFLLQQD